MTMHEHDRASAAEAGVDTFADEKYVVVKRDAMNTFLAHLHSQGQFALLEHAATLEITGDYFVVREQDVFAPAGLHAYANNIRTALEVSEVHGFTMLEPTTKDYLEDLAEMLVSKALAWQARANFKIPD